MTLHDPVPCLALPRTTSTLQTCALRSLARQQGNHKLSPRYPVCSSCMRAADSVAKLVSIGWQPPARVSMVRPEKEQVAMRAARQRWFRERAANEDYTAEAT